MELEKEGSQLTLEEDTQCHFIIILPFKLFTSKVGILSKDRGMTLAQQIYRKVTKRLGKVKLLSLKEASLSKFKKRLTPEPREKMVYRRHPIEEKSFIDCRNFHKIVLTGYRLDFSRFLRALGAKSIVFSVSTDWNESIQSPQAIDFQLRDEEHISEQFKYLARGKDRRWRDVIEERLVKWVDTTTTQFVYEDDYLVNDSNMDAVMEKLDASASERNELLGPPNGARSKFSLESNHVYRLFSSSNESVEVEFFSRQEYKVANRKWIKKNWGVSHVQGYLRILGLERVMPMFREKSVDGRTLLKMTNPVTITTLFNGSNEVEEGEGEGEGERDGRSGFFGFGGDSAGSKTKSKMIKKSEARTLASYVEDLGDVDNMEVMALVAEEVESIREQASSHGLDAGDSVSQIGDDYREEDEEDYREGLVDAQAYTVNGTFVEDGNIDTEREGERESYRDGDRDAYDDDRSQRSGASQRSGRSGRSGISGRSGRSGRMQDDVESIGANSRTDRRRERGDRNRDRYRDDDSYRGNDDDDGDQSQRSGRSYRSDRDRDRDRDGRGRDKDNGQYDFDDNRSQGSRRSRRSNYWEDDLESIGANSRRSRRDEDYYRSEKDVYVERYREEGDYYEDEEEDDMVSVRSGGSHRSNKSYSSNRSGRSLGSGKSRRRAASADSRRSGRGRSRGFGNEDDEDEGFEDEMTYKVVMVGVVGVGKKSLMRRFGGAEFSSSEISKMTSSFVSSDVDRFIVKTWDEKGQAVRDQLAENRRNVLPFTKTADILMVVYDITNGLSFKYLPDILAQIVSNGTSPWMSLALVGNKLDRDNRAVSSEDAFELCRRFGFGTFFETSAKTGANVTELLSVVLSRCEQDRQRELLQRPKSGFGLGFGSDQQGSGEVTLAGRIANFFGLSGSSGSGSAGNVPASKHSNGDESENEEDETVNKRKDNDNEDVDRGDESVIAGGIVVLGLKEDDDKDGSATLVGSTVSSRANGNGDNRQGKSYRSNRQTDRGNGSGSGGSISRGGYKVVKRAQSAPKNRTGR